MEKEFEALEKIDNTLCLNWNNGYLEFALDTDNHCDISSHKEMIDCLDAIQQALLELEQIKEVKPCEAIEELENYLFNEWKQNHVNVGCDYKLEAELAKQLNNLKAIKNALLEFKRLDLLLKLPSEQSSSHFTYKDKNLVCMQSTKYSKLMNAFLEYEETQELEKVLEVIFEKPLSLLVLKLFERSGISDLEYEFFVEGYKAVIEEINEDVKEQIATEEEFNLLKRHLNGK